MDIPPPRVTDALCIKYIGALKELDKSLIENLIKI